MVARKRPDGAHKREKVDPVTFYAQVNNITRQDAKEKFSKEESAEDKRRQQERDKRQERGVKPVRSRRPKRERVKRTDKFAPKLDELTRKELYAAFKCHRDVFGELNDSECYKLLAKVSGLNRSSIHRLLNDSCGYYGPVKSEFKEMKAAAFDKAYASAGLLERIEQAVAE